MALLPLTSGVLRLEGVSAVPSKRGNSVKS